MGAQPSPFLQNAGFTEPALTDLDGLISWSGLNLLLESVSDELNRPAFGLEWASSIPNHFPNAGPTLLISYFVETAKEWLEGSVRYWRNHTNAFALELLTVETDRTALRFSIQSPIPAARQTMEYLLGSTCRMLTSTLGADDGLRSRVVRFRHSKPSSTEWHQQVFGCRVEFNSAYDEILFDRTVLAQKPPRPLTRYNSVMDRHVRLRARQTPYHDHTMATTVAAAIRSVIGTGFCSAEFVAHSLGISAKKLQRLLSREDTSYSTILENVRREMATNLLSRSNAPISRIAEFLDYSTIAPFTLAFKRWTGKSPRAFRRDIVATYHEGDDSTEDSERKAG